MQTRQMPTSILNFVSFSLGLSTCVPVLAAGIVYLMLHLAGLGTTSLLTAVFAISTLALVSGVIVRTLSLAALVYVTRGRAALEWCTPGECATFPTWLGCSWGFPGADGWQEGIRVCGLGIALRGTHGTESSHG